MSRSGIFYQSPENKNELWMNFGHIVPDAQLYAPYSPYLADAGLSEANYNILIEFLKREFAPEKLPFSSVWEIY